MGLAMNVHITPTGFRLAVLEGAHASENRTLKALMKQLREVSKKRDELLHRIQDSHDIKTRIEEEMALILSERKAA